LHLRAIVSENGMDRGVIFDVDGTLVDSVDLHARAWQETFDAFGHHVPFERVREQIGKGGDQLLPVFLSEDEVRHRGKAIEDYRQRLFLEKYLPQVRPFPRVRELFARLRADRHRIALASSAHGTELDTYKRITGIDGLVDADASKDDVSRSKPHPDIFEAALDRLGMDPAAVVVIGDSPYDAEAARRARLRTIGVLCGGFDPTWLLEAGCIALFRDPADLLTHYDRSPLARDNQRRDD
jgi:HAD superfamily hydrolase (TIGR01509 family)